MKKKTNKHIKRVRKLLLICTLMALVLSTGTYAWFIGMKTVNVSSFDVELAAIDRLSLSLDGISWADTVTISKDNFQTVNESNNTNSWGGDGLIPVSSVGIIDDSSSRMVMYEKGSFTTTPGGYRIMASKVKNTEEGQNEQDGYVAFDLFIRNLSGHQYYKDLNVLNEEAIYLTNDSSVKVASSGGVAGTGIENSVRIAFAQIGRVEASTTTQSVITGITCTSDTNVTGICSDRAAQIWEPNDRSHVQNAINWYETSCLKRTGADLTKAESYAGTCNTVQDGVYSQTYAVSGVIDYTDQVDAYDGAAYNTYTGSVADAPATGKLYAYQTFTDEMKVRSGVDRPTFFTLAPNSITKVRIYIWIEGQDIDNYDFASLGKKISVAFGFTKERLYDEDFEYENPEGADLPDDVVKAKHPDVTGLEGRETQNNG